eukprot:CAMPEP_0170522222 /NCGR_PEP_ID=MMETSP0209-20121228/7684_1 /TAXON_ID=665100 ORGANISM="Litonotus pictus, Strain P1" /NCGR_SAMPLE_ID=MMETSP0209 /ASSEMBLY_ACC=CAM_ASM_000301 /LENGTH=531 /DNA_ID=CAMNT_0010809639 /DNA_START=30 /DNA_END=1625 /DNA_ORIENTATION=-
MMETAKKREETKSKKLDILKRPTRNFVNGISEELIQKLMSFGFELEQIMAAHSKYKFNDVEEALTIMTRDQETKLFNHEFVKDPHNRNCAICKSPETEHFNRVEYPVSEEQKKRIREFKERGNNSQMILSDNDIEGLNLEGSSKRAPNNIESKLKVLNADYDENICPICFDNSIKDSYFAMECKHKVCLQCVKDYFRINISEGKVANLICLYGGCNFSYPHEIVKKFSSSNDWGAYKRYVKNQERLNILLNNPNIIHCPFPDCNELIELHNVQVGMLLPEHFVTCNEEHSFCLRCRQLEEEHSRNGCEGSNEKLLKDITTINRENRLFYKQCPMCKIIIEKAEGCNKIRCLNCDFEFCWLCLQEYEEDHYAIYNFSGCPGLENAENEESTWRANGCTKCLVSFCSCILMLVIAIFIIAFFLFFGCAFEFVNYYLTSTDEEDKEEYSSDQEMGNREPQQRYERGTNTLEVRDDQEHQRNNIKKEEGCTAKKVIICVLLALLGICLQPLYLLFYILIGMMECYRRFACWYFYF